MKKQNYKTQREILTQLLNEWDPIGVLPFKGGPKDEYECFIPPILKLLKDKNRQKKLRIFLVKHLNEHCGLSFLNKEKLNKFIDKILNWWKDNY